MKSATTASDIPDFSPSSPAQSRTDIMALVTLLRRRIWIILAIIFVVMAAAVAVVQTLQPRFTAEALVLIDPRPSQSTDVESLLAGRSPDTATIESQVQIMRSRLLAARAILKLGLLEDPEFNPALLETTATATAMLFEALISSAAAATPPVPKDRQTVSRLRAAAAPVPERHPRRAQSPPGREPAAVAESTIAAVTQPRVPAVKSVQSPQPKQTTPIQPAPAAAATVMPQSKLLPTAQPRDTAALPSPAGIDPMVLEQALKIFQERLEVQRRGLSYAVAVRFTSTDAQKAALIANTVANLYIDDQLQSKQNTSQWTGRWLSEKIADLQDQVLKAEEAIETYRADNDLLNNKGLTLIEQQMTDINAQLVAARADRYVADSKFQRVQRLVGKDISLDALQEVLTSRTIANLRQDESRLATREAELTARYNDNYPALIDVRAEIAKVGQQIQLEVSRIANSLRAEAEATRERETLLTQNLRSLEAEAAIGNRARVKLRELERIADASREQYQVYLARFQQVEGQEGTQRAEARLITEAGIPVDPSFPKKKLMLAGGLAFATVLALIMAVIVDLTDLRLYTSWQVERYLGMKTLGIVPLLSGAKGNDGARDMAVEMVREQPNSYFSEAIRNTRRNLPLGPTEGGGVIYLVTSALPHEGKTTTVAALAYSLARTGLNVLVMDSDLRRPSLSKLFRLEDQTGLMDLLRDNESLHECLHLDGRAGAIPSATEGALHIMPIGTHHRRDLDELTADQLTPVLQRLRTAYDVILLDSAPVLAASDAQILTGIADGALLVVRWGNTPRDAAFQAAKLLRAAVTAPPSGSPSEFDDDPIVGAILTGVDMKRVSRYGFGDASYYFNRYSSYYTHETG